MSRRSRSHRFLRERYGLRVLQVPHFDWPPARRTKRPTSRSACFRRRNARTMAGYGEWLRSVASSFRFSSSSSCAPIFTSPFPPRFPGMRSNGLCSENSGGAAKSRGRNLCLYPVERCERVGCATDLVHHHLERMCNGFATAVQRLCVKVSKQSEVR